MKTKDNLLKGIIIGVCVVVVPLLTTGLTLNEGEVGTYQISSVVSHVPGYIGTNIFVFETIINTKSGEVVKRNKVVIDKKNMKWDTEN